MNARTVYTWQPADPSMDFLEEAVNRLANFKREEEDDLAVRAFRRVSKTGDGFAAADITHTEIYLSLLAGRAEARVEELRTARAAKRTTPAEATLADVLIESLAQAGANARTAAGELRRIFNAAKASL